MFPSEDVLFQKNSVCKRCMYKPCRKLLTGRVFPGKIIFVHRREFISLPCMGDIVNRQNLPEQEVLTDDLEIITGNLMVSNPRWEHTDPQKQQNTPDGCSVGDTINLTVDIQNYPESARVTFDIFDTSMNPPFLIKTISGTHHDGCATVQWLVNDPNARGRDLRLEFEGIARSLSSGKTEIDVNGAQFRVDLMIDPSIAESKDDTYILFSTDKTYFTKKTIRDDKVQGDDYLTLCFNGIQADLIYCLAVDPGNEGEPYYIFQNVQGTQLLGEEQLEHVEYVLE